MGLAPPQESGDVETAHSLELHSVDFGWDRPGLQLQLIICVTAGGGSALSEA